MMTPFFSILVAGVITVGVLLWMPSKLIWPWIRVIRTRTDQRIEDMTAQAIRPPAPVADAIGQLQEMGFERVGESKTYLWLGAAVTWYVVSREGAIMAEVVEYGEGYAASFTTMLGDESVVETSYPIGERVKTPVHVSDFTRISLQAAHDLHTGNVETFSGRRLSPSRHIDSMESVLLLEGVYREKHYQRKLLRPLMRGVWLTLFLLVPAGISLYVLWRINFTLQTSTDNLQQVARQLGPFVLVGGLSLAGFFAMFRKFLHHAGQ
jgi:hypothetical protein